MYLDDRDSGFPKLINLMGYKIGIEIGVRHGGYSGRLLKSSLDKLYGIDIAETKRSRKLHNDNYPRYELIIKSSVEAAKDFLDNFFDFIHIDASHSYNDVKEDINVWWPKLKVGGCISGDDFMVADSHPEGKFGVIQAVEEFAASNNLQLFITHLKIDSTKEERYNFANETWLKEKGPDGRPNWYIFK